MPDERTFVQILRDHVGTQADLVAALTAHPTLVGAGRERAVMDMLRGQLPRRYEVLSGTILGQGDSGGWQREDRQLDVMVVDTFDYPTLLRHGDIAVVLPQAVRTIIEVKSNLQTPPDPDATPKEAAPGAGQAPAEKQKKDTSKKKETFLTAIEQSAEMRSLFDADAPVLTILVSHEYPTDNDTLRGWLDRVARTRHKWREELGKLDKEGSDYASTKLRVDLLDASLLPNVIIADKGALAVKEKGKYEFFKASQDKKAAPGLVTLVSYIVEHLDRQDPVLALTRADPKHDALGALRQDAGGLFREIMAPQIVRDQDNAALDLSDRRPAPDQDEQAHGNAAAPPEGRH